MPNVFERTKKMLKAQTGMTGTALDAAVWDQAVAECEAGMLAGQRGAEMGVYTYRKMAQMARGEIAFVDGEIVPVTAAYP